VEISRKMWKFPGKCGNFQKYEVKNRNFPEKCGNFRKYEVKNRKFPENVEISGKIRKKVKK
jgi:hypothetical protein